MAKTSEERFTSEHMLGGYDGREVDGRVEIPVGAWWEGGAV